MRILPEVLQDDMETGHVVVLTVHILHGHIGGHLGEGLQQLGEGQVIASRRRLHQKYLMVYIKNISCESHLGIIAGQDGEHGSVVVVYPVLGRGSLLHSGGHSEAEEGDEEDPILGLRLSGNILLVHGRGGKYNIRDIT